MKTEEHAIFLYQQIRSYTQNSLVRRLRSQLALIVLFLFSGFIILLHQFLNWGVWFQPKDLHHETFALLCFAVAFGIYVGMMSKSNNAAK